MAIDHESLKRVLTSIKGAARGFKKEKLQGRLSPKPEAELDAVANPLDAKPEDPLAMPAGLEGSPEEESTEAPMESMGESEDAEAKLAAIRKLIGSV